jgi:hypothetical protein
MMEFQIREFAGYTLANRAAGARASCRNPCDAPASRGHTPPLARVSTEHPVGLVDRRRPCFTLTGVPALVSIISLRHSRSYSRRA